MMNECTMKFLQNLSKSSTDSEIEITERIRILTLQIMGYELLQITTELVLMHHRRSVLSCDLFSNDPEDTELLHLVRASFEGMTAAALTPPFLRNFPLPSLRKLRRSIQRLREIVQSHMDARRQAEHNGLGQGVAV